MTATPIPRTLLTALIGIQDVSVIASPPSRRRPIRTFLTDYDGGSVRTAPLREKQRGGQSFVVVPRVEDMGPISDELARLVPELTITAAHGQMTTTEMDDAMVGFADGDSDEIGAHLQALSGQSGWLPLQPFCLEILRSSVPPWATPR